MAFASEIREFDIPTLEKLGRELSHRDEIAAQASDLVWKQYPEFRNVSPQGWVSDLHHDADLVYFIMETKAGLDGAYKVTFPRSGSPRVEDIHGQPLIATIATRSMYVTTTDGAAWGVPMGELLELMQKA
jgi:hypothetical protein